MTTTITPQFASTAFRHNAKANANRTQVGYSSGNGFSSGNHSNLSQQPKFGLEPMTMGLSALGCCCLVPILAIGGLLAMLFRGGK